MRHELNLINNFCQKSEWYEFEIYKYDERSLCVCGSIDLSYGYDLLILFNAVFRICSNMRWCCDTDKDFFMIKEVAGEEYISNEENKWFVFMDDNGNEQRIFANSFTIYVNNDGYWQTISIENEPEK